MILILFLSSLQDEVGLLILLRFRFRVLLQVRILLCLLLPFVRILLVGHVLQLYSLCLENYGEGEPL